MDEFTVKSLLKKMKQHETTMSALMGIVAVGLGVYAIFPYFSRIQPQQETSLMIVPSPIPVMTSLPEKADMAILPVKYTVNKGDSTSKIARAFYGSETYVENIERENNLQTGQQLEEGITISIPKPLESAPPKMLELDGEPVTYTTLPNDTLWNLALKYYNNGNQWSRIYEANKSIIKDPNNLEKNLVLTIPQ